MIIRVMRHRKFAKLGENASHILGAMGFCDEFRGLRNHGCIRGSSAGLCVPIWFNSSMQFYIFRKLCL